MPLRHLKDTNFPADRNLKWLLGPLAAPRIYQIAEAFQKKKALEFKRLNYIPWMTYSREIENLRELIDSPLPEGLITDEKNLLLLKDKLETSSGNLKLIRSPELRVSIDTEIARTKPWLENEFKKSIEVLLRVSPWISPLIFKVVRQFIPVVYQGLDKRGRAAFSQHDTKGIIYLSLPEPGNEAPELRWGQNAIDIAHELGHNILMLYLAADSFIVSDPRILVYSGARRTERPSYPAIHSAMALSYMLSTASRISYTCGEFPTEVLQKFHKIANDLCEDLQLNLESLRLRCRFTEFGQSAMQDMEKLVQDFKTWHKICYQ